jgi:hypothetical protein
MRCILTSFLTFLSALIAAEITSSFVRDLTQLLPQYLNGNASLIELTTANRAARTLKHQDGRVQQTRLDLRMIQTYLRQLIPNWNISLEDANLLHEVAANRHLTPLAMITQARVAARNSNRETIKILQALAVVHKCVECFNILERAGVQLSGVGASFRTINSSPIRDRRVTGCEPGILCTNNGQLYVGVHEVKGILWCCSSCPIPLSLTIEMIDPASKDFVSTYLTALSELPEELKQFRENLAIIRRWLALPIPRA